MTTPRPPRRQDERDLERIQAKMTKASIELDQARALRDQIAFKLWRNAKMPQDEITARLDRADRNAGGTGVTIAAVQKALFRYRKQMERTS